LLLKNLRGKLLGGETWEREKDRMAKREREREREMDSYLED